MRLPSREPHPFYCADRYERPGDPLRAKVVDLQDATATAVLDTCSLVGIRLTAIPPGLSVAGQVTWITQRVDPLLTAATDEGRRV